MAETAPPAEKRGGAPSACELWFNLAVISGVYGSSFLFVKLIGHTLPVFAFAAGRGFVAAVALLVFLGLRRLLAGPSVRRTPRSKTLCHMIVLGTTNGWLTNVLVAIAVKRVDTAVVAMIQAAVPLITAVLAHVMFYEERLRSDQLLGILTGLFGVLLIIGPVMLLGTHGSLIGLAAMLLTAFLYACGLVYARQAAHENPAMLACGQQACGAAVAAGIAFLCEPATVWSDALGVWPLLLVLGVVCSAVPTALLLRLVQRAPSVPSAMIAYLQPAWATLLGMLVLAEPIRPAGLIGTAVIVAGVMVATRTPKRRPSSAPLPGISGGGSRLAGVSGS